MVRDSNLQLDTDTFKLKSFKIAFFIQQTQNKFVLVEKCYQNFGLDKINFVFCSMTSQNSYSAIRAHRIVTRSYIELYFDLNCFYLTGQR